MTYEEFQLLCNLNASRPNTQGWTPEQTAIICLACSEANFEPAENTNTQNKATRS